MKIEFITNASALATLNGGRTVLFDPWYSDGIIHGSWYNFPPLADKDKHLSLKPSFIYVSHIHQDHLDARTLMHYPKDAEIWIGKLPHPHLESKIRSLGFRNVRLFELGRPTPHEGLTVTIFGDFSGASFGQADAVDYAIDTSLHVRDEDGRSLFNVNDNTIQVRNAEEIRRELGVPDVSMVPASGASIYPHGMRHYSAAEKERLTAELRTRMLKRFIDVSRTLGSPFVIPAAGTYVMGGSLAPFSRYLHQPTGSDLEKTWAESKMAGQKLAHLYEGDVLDAGTGNISRNPKALFRDYTAEDRLQYALTLSGKPLDHEKAVLPEGFEYRWPALLKKARQTMWKHQKNYDSFPKWDAKLVLEGAPIEPFYFAFDAPDEKNGPAQRSAERGLITFYIDYRLMTMVLLSAAHWNNIEAGAQVNVEREPDRYEPTVHSLMSFFHL